MQDKAPNISIVPQKSGHLAILVVAAREHFLHEQEGRAVIRVKQASLCEKLVVRPQGLLECDLSCALLQYIFYIKRNFLGAIDFHTVLTALSENAIDF